MRRVATVAVLAFFVMGASDCDDGHRYPVGNGDADASKIRTAFDDVDGRLRALEKDRDFLRARVQALEDEAKRARKPEADK